MFDAHTHQELQQSVRSINIIDNFIHVLYRSLAELLHHKKNIDQQSTKDLQKRGRNFHVHHFGDIEIGSFFFFHTARAQASVSLCMLPAVR